MLYCFLVVKTSRSQYFRRRCYYTFKNCENSKLRLYISDTVDLKILIVALNDEAQHVH